MLKQRPSSPAITTFLLARMVHADTIGSANTKYTTPDLPKRTQVRKVSRQRAPRPPLSAEERSAISPRTKKNTIAKAQVPFLSFVVVVVVVVVVKTDPARKCYTASSLARFAE